MSIVYLNGDYLPMSEARISPMDRGFLFGDGIYEVIPSYDGCLVGFVPHMERMQAGLSAIGINYRIDHQQWRDIANALIEKNGGGNLALYFHISRGADTRRNHAFPEGVEPTCYAYAFEIPAEPVADRKACKPYTVVSTEDRRWRNCHIKSTALLGNVLHYQYGARGGHGETILYNSANEITEASASNVFAVIDNTIYTPPQDHQILPGITRNILLDALRKHSDWQVEEAIITLDDLKRASEIWLTSSTKEVAPVVELDGAPVGDGKVGELWEQVQRLFSQYKYDY
ncbi:MAG: D-alanine aminotransferase [Gammaproteobacteria bacterium]|nr:MAG: D-alanine aminotransferase [Gammaproteobacteria bacterium]PIE39571.1 MAG: D-alanine aminotransferase [Gammaproteobacteria bacterium]